MDDGEKSIYATNIAIIIQADGVFAPEEEELLDTLSLSTGIDAYAWEAIVNNLPKNAKIDLVGLRRFSNRVRCLEDMIEISLTDGDLADAEKTILFQAAQFVGITHQQVMTIVSEARKRCADPA